MQFYSPYNPGSKHGKKSKKQIKFSKNVMDQNFRCTKLDFTIWIVQILLEWNLIHFHPYTYTYYIIIKYYIII